MRSRSFSQLPALGLKFNRRRETMSGWQSIETAPKDGTVVDLWGERIGRLPEMAWDSIGRGGAWVIARDMTAYEHWQDRRRAHTPFISHWMPVPAPPASGIEAPKAAKRDSGSTEGESPVGKAETP
jgi:hypothetical protein